MDKDDEMGILTNGDVSTFNRGYTSIFFGFIRKYATPGYMQTVLRHYAHVLTDIFGDSSDSPQSSETNTNGLNEICSKERGFFQRSENLIRWTIFKILRFVKDVIVGMVFMFIFVATLPYLIIRSTIKILKCITNSSLSIFNAAIFIIPTVPMYFLASIRNIFSSESNLEATKCESRIPNVSKTVEGNQSNSSYNHRSHNRALANIKMISFMSLGLAFGIVISLYYADNDDKARPSFVRKSFLGHYSQKMYTLPGEKCMRAGRCCRGHLEATFRWMACFSTIPIRILVSAWPKSPVDATIRHGGMEVIGSYIDKLAEQLREVKEEMNYQGQRLLKIQSDVIYLEQSLQEKTNSINNLKPEVQKSTQSIEQISKEVDIALSSTVHIATIRDDVDRMTDSVKSDAEDALRVVSVSISRLKNSIDAEQHRIHAQISNLELLLKEDIMKKNDKNQRVLQKILNEIDQIKVSQQDVNKRMTSLSKLHLTFHKSSEGLQKDLRNKLHGDVVHHEQMSKRTEKMCENEIVKLEQNLAKTIGELNCFTNRTVQKEEQAAISRLRDDISNSLYERTRNIVKILTEKALLKQPKSYFKSKIKLKKCGLMAHVFNMDDNDSECIIDDGRHSEKLVIERKEIKSIVDDIIDDEVRMFAADDIGVADYALESSGGSIVPDRSSPTYSGRAAFLSIFGFTFGKVVKSIRKVIQTSHSMPGECWAFKSEKGHVVILLSRSIAVTAVSIDHVSSLLTPDGKILSAPKNFNLYALSSYDDYMGTMLGEFEYSTEGSPIQTFQLREDSAPTRYIQVNFLSNHGNEEYTCIYRIRIHGNPANNLTH